jgi:threonine dehydratase
VIVLAEIAEAARRIGGHVRTTPLAEIEPDRLWFKLEQLQHTGSFKVRGALNRVLAAAETGGVPAAGVVAASGGNAGLAVAYAAARTGVPARVFVPRTAPEVKVRRIREYGADVVQIGEIYHEAYDAAAKSAAETGALFCHAFDQPEICAGQGTLGLEVLEQCGGVDTIVLAAGGGGLMAGVAAAVAGRARVVVAEPELAPTLHAALAAGRPVRVPVSGVAADSLGASKLGEIAFDVATRTGVRSVLIGEADIVAARRALWEEYRLLAEHGPATAAAALRTGAYRPEPGERVVVVLSGANTDPAVW